MVYKLLRLLNNIRGTNCSQGKRSLANQSNRWQINAERWYKKAMFELRGGLA